MAKRRILIADAGGTSTVWTSVDVSSMAARSITAPALNAAVSTDQQIADAIDCAAGLLDSADRIFFYGAGCINSSYCARIYDAIRRYCQDDVWVEVESDMLGAARGLLRHEQGVACILGTGANTAMYDGNVICSNIPPLGFILGDEGSGASLGKRFLKMLLRNELPDAVCNNYYSSGGDSYQEIIQKVYREPFPNKYLASFSRYLKECLPEESIQKLVRDEFRSFFDSFLMRYRCDTPVRAAFTGSVALHFKEQLMETASDYPVEIVRIVQSPMEGLISYHCQH